MAFDSMLSEVFFAPEDNNLITGNEVTGTSWVRKASFLILTGKRYLKAEILSGGSEDCGSKRSGKAKEKRDGTIGLLGGFIRPKVLEPCGLSLETSAIYGRIYLGFLYEMDRIFVI